MIAGGRLNRRITFQKPVRSDNSFNESVISAWPEVCSVWAEIKTLSAKEIVQGPQVNHLATHIVTIRHRCDIRSDQRINYKGRIFEIDGIINPNEANEELEITCHEVTSRG